MKEGDKSAKKCWWCKYVNRCQILTPCDRFEKYNYYNHSDISASDAAKAIGVSIKHFYRLKRTNPQELLSRLNKATGKHYAFESETHDGKRQILKEINKHE